jgi:nitrogen regulatory protein PII
MTAERDGLKAENYDIKEYLEQAHNTEIELIAMTAERDDAIRRIDCTNKACRTCTGAVYPARAEKIIEAMTAERDAAQKHEGLAYQMVDELRGIIGTTYTEEQVNAIRQQTVEEVVNVFEQLCKDYASPTGNIYNLDIISAIRKEFLS